MALYSEGKGKSKKTSVWLLNHVSGTLWKIWPKLFKPDIRNPLQSSPILTILIPVWFISLKFFYLTKLLFCDFFDLKVVLDIVKKYLIYRDILSSLHKCAGLLLA